MSKEEEIGVLIRQIYYDLIVYKFFEFLQQINVVPPGTYKDVSISSKFCMCTEIIEQPHNNEPSVQFYFDLGVFDKVNNWINSGEYTQRKITFYIIEAFFRFLKENEYDTKINFNFEVRFFFKGSYLYHRNVFINENYEVDEKFRNNKDVIFEDMICIKNLYHYYTNYKLIYDNGMRRSGLTTANIYKFW